MMVAPASRSLSSPCYLRVRLNNDRAIACFKARGSRSRTLRDDHTQWGARIVEYLSVLRDERRR
jgi:hypothetical protein